MPKTMILPLAGRSDFIILDLTDDARGIAGHHRVRRNITCHHRPRAHNCAFADCYSRQNAAIEADPDIPADPDGPGCFSAFSFTAAPLFQEAPARGGIERGAIRIHKYHVPGNERMIPYLNGRIANEPRPVDQNKIANDDTAPAADVEHRP